MILGYYTIWNEYKNENITIDPFNINNLGPNSYDITLGSNFKKVLSNCKTIIPSIDPDLTQEYEDVKLDNWTSQLILPGELWLAHTVEKIGSNKYVPMLEGRSSIGRMGLFIHITAGFGDIGFAEQWTLELTCTLPIWIRSGMRIGQVFFHTITDDIVQYNGRYKNQSGAQESKFNE